MPSTATITAYYTFTANTKARASQVNTNFNNYRGHNLPIDPNTIAGVDNTYDHGSAEYQWRTGYFGTSIILSGLTTTGHTTFKDTGATTGGLDILIGGTVASRFVAPTETAQDITAGYGQWAVGTTILGATTSASPQDVYGLTTVAENIRYSTLTVATTGRPIRYGAFSEVPASELTTTATIVVTPGMYTLSSVTGQNIDRLFLMRDGTTLPAVFSGYGNAGGENTPPGAFEFIDINPPATSAAQYELCYHSFSTNETIAFNKMKFYVREL